MDFVTQQQQRQQQQQQREHPDADLDVTPCSTQTLAQFVKLAQDYKGWSRSQLARVLGRDATKIVPQSGNPKLDLVTNLARVLEWSIGDVAEMLAGATEDAIPPAQCDGMSPAEVIQAGQAANAQRDFPAAVAYGEWGEAVGEDDETRSRAVNIQAIAWDGVGRYDKTIRALRRGLRFPNVSLTRRRLLQSNLAHAHLVNGNLEDAIAISSLLIDQLQFGPLTLRDHCTAAFCHFVRAGALRRLAPQIQSAEYWNDAIASYETAIRMYKRISELQLTPSVDSIMHISAGGIIECKVALMPSETTGAIERIEREVERFDDEKHLPKSPDSLGWWCVFGANIALRMPPGESRNRSLAVFTNKAHEIAEFCEEWSLWERVLTVEYMSPPGDEAQSFAGYERVLDAEDVRIIVGAIGRFPRFRPIGLGLLNTAQILDSRRDV